MSDKRGKIIVMSVMDRDKMKSDTPPDIRQFPFGAFSCHVSSVSLVNLYIRVRSRITLAELQERQMLGIRVEGRTE